MLLEGNASLRSFAQMPDFVRFASFTVAVVPTSFPSQRGLPGHIQARQL